MTSAPRAYADTIRALGGPEVSPREIVAVWHIRPTQVVLEHFLGRQISPHDIEVFRRCFGAVVATVQPYPGVVGKLDALDRGGYRLGVFTTATHRAGRSGCACALHEVSSSDRTCSSPRSMATAVLISGRLAGLSC